MYHDTARAHLVQHDDEHDGEEEGGEGAQRGARVHLLHGVVCRDVVQDERGAGGVDRARAAHDLQGPAGVGGLAPCARARVCVQVCV